MNLISEIKQIEKDADCLYTASEISQRIRELASDIQEKLADQNPLVLTILNGGLVFAGHLLPHLNFPLQIDYMHATRYRGETEGSDMEWLAQPQSSLKGRNILVVDDILDQGYTLKAVIERCFDLGAKEVSTAVLLKKRLPADKQVEIKTEFIGFEIEDRYVFGYGMDYKNYLRNAPGIFAVATPQ